MGETMVMLFHNGQIVKCMLLRDKTIDYIEAECRTRWQSQMQLGARILIGPVTQMRECRAQLQECYESGAVPSNVYVKE